MIDDEPRFEEMEELTDDSGGAPGAPFVEGAAPVTSGLVLHLDADAITGLSDGDTVSTWTDISGSGNSGSAIGAPSYHTGVVNGKPVVRLDGVGQAR